MSGITHVLSTRSVVLINGFTWIYLSKSCTTFGDVKLLNQLTNSTQTMNNLDENYNADLLDAMSDIAYQQEQAMRESNEDQWEGVIHDDEDS
jgi:hypothetical protein